MLLSQTGLIERILSVMDMTECNRKYTPADKIPLGKDVDGDPYMEEWDYRSVVGMMLYLASSTRSVISYAVHQCAWFSHNHKRLHKVKIKLVARYLKETRDKGLILSPDSSRLQLDFFAGADFAGLFVAEAKNDSI